MGDGRAISDLVVREGLFEKCCLSLGEKDKPHRDLGREFQAAGTLYKGQQVRQARKSARRESRRGETQWARRVWEVSRARSHRIHVLGPQCRSHRGCHALSLLINLLATVCRSEQRAQEQTHEAQLGSQPSHLVDRK